MENDVLSFTSEVINVLSKAESIKEPGQSGWDRLNRLRSMKKESHDMALHRLNSLTARSTHRETTHDELIDSLVDAIDGMAGYIASHG
ncbi:MAG: hypothetical protein HQM11_05110 [SAR324 cluster bacterium]|nr:hypothetical protein [SAR324 cluster bacterium]